LHCSVDLLPPIQRPRTPSEREIHQRGRPSAEIRPRGGVYSTAGVVSAVRTVDGTVGSTVVVAARRDVEQLMHRHGPWEKAGNDGEREGGLTGNCWASWASMARCWARYCMYVDAAG
jgi:hypothetical protein